RGVGQRIDGNGDHARGGSEYRSAEAVVVLVPRAVTGVGACIAGDDQVVGEALVRIPDVVVLVRVPAAPVHRELDAAGAPQRSLRLVVDVIARGRLRRRAHTRGEDRVPAPRP